MNDKIKLFLIEKRNQIIKIFNKIKTHYLNLTNNQKDKVLYSLIGLSLIILIFSFIPNSQPQTIEQDLIKNIEKVQQPNLIKPQNEIKGVNPILLNEFKRLKLSLNTSIDSEMFNKYLAKEIQKMTKNEFKADVKSISQVLSRAYATNDFQTLTKIKNCVLN